MRCAARLILPDPPSPTAAAAAAAATAVVSRVERVTPPARVSASLERMTAGYDPERRGVVMPDGSLLLGGGGGGDGRVVQERVDLREPPKDK